MTTSEDLDILERVREFRLEYFKRIVIVLAGVIWGIGSYILILQASAQKMILVFGFEIAAGLSYYLVRREAMLWARGAFTAASLAWLAGVVWLVGEPILLVLFALAAVIYATYLNLAWTVVLTLAILAGEVLITASRFPSLWSGWQGWVAPLATLLIVILIRLRETDFEMLLHWVRTSTLASQEHLKEAREHRARLFRTVKDLDDAYHRLERSNEMLLAARAEAERAYQARNQFALTISHELRTPLSFIIGFSEVMVNSPQLYAGLALWPPGLYEDVQDIYRSSHHLLALVNDVLDLGKVDANRMLLVKENFTPAAMLEEVVEIMREAVEAKGLWLRTQCEPGLPEIYIDRTRIRQVLINLMNNSLRFTERGGITLSAARHEEGILFSVQDTGPGIAENELTRVFEEFGQASAVAWRRQDGTGLGIPISRRFVEMHGGRIWVESVVGDGATFFFNIPLPGSVAWPRWLAGPDQIEPDRTEYWKVKELENQATQLLLLVSPDPGAGNVIENYLPGYQVQVVTNAAEAQPQLEHLLPQGLIIDQSIQDRPETDALLRSLPYDLPVMVFAIPGSMAAFHALPEGVVDYLSKPVLRENLISALTRLDRPVGWLWVIDDDPSMARFVQLAVATIVEEDRPILLHLGSAQDALEHMRGLRDQPQPAPDAILLDIGLPDMTGWDLLPLLREGFPASGLKLPPVILFTAATISEELEARKRKVFQLSTLHPFSGDDLGAVIHALLKAIPTRFNSPQSGPLRSEDLAG